MIPVSKIIEGTRVNILFKDEMSEALKNIKVPVPSETDALILTEPTVIRLLESAINATERVRPVRVVSYARSYAVKNGLIVNYREVNE